MNILKIIFLLLITTNIGIADDSLSTENLKQYDVEIIIFEDAHARYINSESWNKDTPNNEEVLSEENTSNKKSNNSAHNPIKPKMLNDEYKRINNSSEFNVLLYSAWRQTGLMASKAFAINFSNLANNHRSTSKNIIRGEVKVVLARYLHLYTELEYERVNNVDDENKKYTAQSHRRMRSKELHYIDHPLLGILVQINPVEPIQLD